MFHLNAELRQQGLTGILEEIVLPEIYQAVSLSDFIEQRKSTKPTSSWKCYLSAAYHLDPGALDIEGTAVISVRNVRCNQQKDSSFVELQDHTTELHLKLWNPKKFYKHASEQELLTSDRVQLAILLYYPSYDTAQLLLVIKNLHLPTPPEKSTLTDLALAYTHP